MRLQHFLTVSVKLRRILAPSLADFEDLKIVVQQSRTLETKQRSTAAFFESKRYPAAFLEPYIPDTAAADRERSAKHGSF